MTTTRACIGAAGWLVVLAVGAWWWRLVRLPACPCGCGLLDGGAEAL